MGFFNSGFFWFLEGILLCLAILGLKTWAEDKKITIALWKYALIILWLFFVGFTFAFIGTSYGENEFVAAELGALVFGIISIISGFGLYRVLTAKKTT